MQKQKFKKLLCILLSVLTVLTFFSAGFTAAAQENTVQGAAKKNYSDYIKDLSEMTPDAFVSLVESSAIYFAQSSAAYLENLVRDKNVVAVEEKIQNFAGDVSKADATDEDIAAYNALTAEFKALTPEQRDSVDVYALSKIVQLVYAREIALQTTGSSTVKRQNAHKKLYDVLGEIPCLRAAEECGAVLVNTKSTGDQMLEAYKNAGSETARIFAGLWYKSYSSFYYKVEGYEGNTLKTIVNLLFDAENLLIDWLKVFAVLSTGISAPLSEPKISLSANIEPICTKSAYGKIYDLPLLKRNLQNSSPWLSSKLISCALMLYKASHFPVASFHTGYANALLYSLYCAASR